MFLLKLTSGTQRWKSATVSHRTRFLKFYQTEYISLHTTSPIFLYYTQLRNFKITPCKFSLALLYVYQDRTASRGLPLMTVAEGRSNSWNEKVVSACASTVRFLSKTTIQLFQCPLLLKYELQKLSKGIVLEYCSLKISNRKLRTSKRSPDSQKDSCHTFKFASHLRGIFSVQNLISFIKGTWRNYFATNYFLSLSLCLVNLKTYTWHHSIN